jgi:prophage maintenance system killer protein
VAFLELNGWQLAASEDDEFDLLVAVAEGKASVADVEQWLAARMRQRAAPPPESPHR